MNDSGKSHICALSQDELAQRDYVETCLQIAVVTSMYSLYVFSLDF